MDILSTSEIDISGVDFLYDEKNQPNSTVEQCCPNDEENNVNGVFNIPYNEHSTPFFNFPKYNQN